MRFPKEDLKALYWSVIVGLIVTFIGMGLGRAGTFGTPGPPSSAVLWLAPGQHLSDDGTLAPNPSKP